MKTVKNYSLVLLALLIVGAPVHAGTTSRVKLFFIALDDNGKTGKKVGCGDSIVPVEADIAPTSAPLKSAYEKLLSLRDDTYGDRKLSNPLSRSNLKVKSVAITKRVAIVKLSGEFVSAGHCESPRLEAQLKSVATQFPSVKNVSVFINGVALRKLLSEQ